MGRGRGSAASAGLAVVEGWSGCDALPAEAALGEGLAAAAAVQEASAEGAATTEAGLGAAVESVEDDTMGLACTEGLLAELQALQAHAAEGLALAEGERDAFQQGMLNHRTGSALFWCGLYSDEQAWADWTGGGL